MAHGALKPAFFLLCLPLLLTLAFFFGTRRFEENDSLGNDLAMAEKAINARDIGDAEMFYERYLRKNSAGEHRWDVWHNLLNISLNMRQDKVTAKNYLEIMLVEYAEDPVRRREIQKRLAGLCDDLRLYDRAAALREALVEDQGTPAEDKAVFYRKLSHAYIRRLEFAMAADVLNLCLELDVSPSTKAECLYDMAEAQMFTDDLEKSEQALRTLLNIPAASPQRRVLAVFMLADVLEQRNRPDEAVQLFESIRETYPNNKVIEMRIAALRGKKTPAKPDVVPVKKR